MPYQNFPINIAGPSYPERSRPLSAMESRNMYHEYVAGGREKLVIKSFPGQAAISNAGSPGVDRGSHQMDETLYRVVGTTLYEVDSAGVHTSRGSVGGTERCIFADDGVNLFIVADNSVHHYNSAATTPTVSPVSDPDITGAQSVAYINNQFLYTFPQLTVVSDVGDGSSASGLNAINEETFGDELVRDYVFDQVIYRFGKRSCPTWWNSGVGTPPIERLEGQMINKGLAAKHSVANTTEWVYFLGHDRNIYQARNGQATKMTPAAIAGVFQGFDTVSDAFAYTFTIDDKEMYVITFPTEDQTWCMVEELGRDGWFELTKGINKNRYNVNSLTEVYSRIFVGDETSGDLNVLSFDSYDQAGNAWLRRRVIGSINGDLLGQKGARVQMNRLELLMEKGVGLLSGQGEDPKIMIEASYDGGRSWDAGTWMRIGRMGEYNLKAEWHNTKAFYEMVIRISISDPVPINIYTGSIDLKLAGW